MSTRKLVATTLIASLMCSSLAMAAPPQAHGAKGNKHTKVRIVPVPKGSPRHHLDSKAVKVLVGGVTLWIIGSSYYKWQQERKVYVPVTVIPDNRVTTTTTVNGPYYSRVPAGSNAVLINGTQYFTHNGEFYLPVQRNGEVVYVKVQL